MGNCRFVIQNLGLGAAYYPWTGYSMPVNEYGFDAFLDPSPSHQMVVNAQFATASFLRRYQFAVDLGQAAMIDTFALINTNITEGSKVTLWCYLDDPAAGGTTVAQMAFTVGDRTRTRNQVVMDLTNKVEMRYMRFFIDNVDTYISIGNVVIGSSWVPTYNFDVQYNTGRLDSGQREVNPTTGAAFNFPGARPRLLTLSLGTLSQTEVETYVDDLDRLAGATGDILFIPDGDDSFQQMSLRAIYGACRLSGEGLAAHFFPNIYRRPFRIQETM